MIFDSLDPEYVKAQMDKLSNLNISLSQLRDALLGTDSKTLTDLYNRLGNIGGSFSITNFPSWFTGSSKKTDDIYTGLTNLNNKLSITNWIGKVGIGDGISVASVISGTLAGASANLVGVAPDLVKMYAGGTNYEESVVVVSTTEAYSSFSPALKFVKVTNEGDVEALIRLNGSSATQIPVPAHTGKWFLFPVSSIYYSTSSGSTTLRIEGFA